MPQTIEAIRAAIVYTKVFLYAYAQRDDKVASVLERHRERYGDKY
jgi:hypothetical protein